MVSALHFVQRNTLALLVAPIASIAVGTLLASGLEGPGIIAAGAFVVVVVWEQRPELVLGTFVFALPLLEGGTAVFGLNRGELATLLMVSIGALSLASPQRVSNRHIRRLLWALVGLGGVGALASTVNGIYTPSAYVASAFKPLSWAILLYLVYVHFDTRKKLHGLLLAILASGATVGVVAVVQHLAGGAIIPSSGGPPRVDATFEHWNQLGGFMALVAIPTLTYALSTNHRGAKTLLFGAFALQVSALLLSATLGSVLALAVAGIVAIRLWSTRPGLGIALTVFPMIGIAVLSLLVPVLATRSHLVRGRATDRLSTYAAGLKLVKDNALFGTGSIATATEEIQQNPKYGYTRFGQTGDQPHNAFISMWVQSGVFAFLLLVYAAWLSLWLFLAARPSPNERDYVLHWGILLGGVAFLVQNFTNSLIIHVRLGLVFFVLVAVAVRLREVSLEPRTAPALIPDPVAQPALWR